MLEALRQADWHNYSLFAQESGDVIGYLECDDFELSRAAMASLQINTEWQTEMAVMFEALGDAMPDETIEPIGEIFHLD